MQLLLSFIFFSGLILSATVADPVPGGSLGLANSTCAIIAHSISNASEVYYPASSNYVRDNTHYMLSSSQASACVVEVGSTADTAKAIKIIGSKRSPFAVIAGGHASNPGFSSTPGVLISLVRMKSFIRAADNSTLLLGTASSWSNDVYPKLDGTGYNVVGGRVTGPAVGGWTLGGGYSWLTNQHGLGCDTVQSYTLVLPNGTVSEVDSSQPDLFFALKGGLNRFGIVTEIRFKLFQHPKQVWGGYQIFAPGPSTDALLSATANFSATNTDPNAQIITTLGFLAGNPSNILLIFYDGPNPGPSLTPFQQIPAILSNVSTQSFSSLTQIAGGQASTTRGAFHTLSTTGLTLNFVKAVYADTLRYNALAADHSGVFIDYDIEPFLTSYGQKATDSAYPHRKSPLPLNLYFTWTSPAEDAFWRCKLQESVDRLTAVAKQEGIWDPELTAYPNYALSTYGGEQLFGGNVERLRAVKQSVDPDGVMELSGGFTI